MEPPGRSSLLGAGPSRSQVKIGNPAEGLPGEAGPYRPLGALGTHPPASAFQAWGPGRPHHPRGPRGPEGTVEGGGGWDHRQLPRSPRPGQRERQVGDVTWGHLDLPTRPTTSSSPAQGERPGPPGSQVPASLRMGYPQAASARLGPVYPSSGTAYPMRALENT